MKPVRELNVRAPSGILTLLLPQGAWARSSACAISRRGARGALDLSQMGGHNATTDLQREIADAAIHQCVQCKATKLKPALRKEHWRHWNQGTQCNECEPRAPWGSPAEFAAAIIPEHTAVERVHLQSMRCGQARERFWPRDLHNQRRGISCTCCHPAPQKSARAGDLPPRRALAALLETARRTRRERELQVGAPPWMRVAADDQRHPRSVGVTNLDVNRSHHNYA